MTSSKLDQKYVFKDGIFHGLMVGSGESYLAAFALFLGMDDVVAGFIVTIPLFFGAVIQLVSSKISHVITHKRWVVLGSVMQALSFIPLIVAAMTKSFHVWQLFLVVTLYWTLALAITPSWNTWVDTLIPKSIRIKFFAKRSLVNHVAVFGAFVTGGVLLNLGKANDLTNFVFIFLFSLAMVCRLVSSWTMSRQSHSREHLKESKHIKLKPLFYAIFKKKKLRNFLFFMILFQFGVQIGAPYFTPFMLVKLKLSYLQYMILIGASFSAKTLILPFHSRLAEKFGVSHLFWLAAIGIFTLPIFWVFGQNFYYLIVVQIFSGCVWAFYELGSFLLFFETVPLQKRTSLLSFYNFFNSSALIFGAMIGGFLLKYTGTIFDSYLYLFLASSAVRLVPVILFAKLRKISVPIQEVPTRTMAVRPSTGTVDRPIFSEMD